MTLAALRQRRNNNHTFGLKPMQIFIKRTRSIKSVSQAYEPQEKSCGSNCQEYSHATPKIMRIILVGNRITPILNRLAIPAAGNPLSPPVPCIRFQLVFAASLETAPSSSAEETIV